MGKQSKARQIKQVIRKGQLLDWLIRIVNKSEFDRFVTQHNHHEWIMLGGIKPYIGQFVSVHNPGAVDYVKDRIKPDIEPSKVMQDVSANARLRPPFGTMIFQFTHPEYLYYGALCIYTEESNSIITQGIRVKRGGNEDLIYLDRSFGITQLSEDYYFDSFSLRHGDDSSGNDAMIGISECLFTLGLLNANNVELVDHEPDKQASRVYALEYGRPLTKYKTLRLKQSKRTNTAYDQQEYQGVMPLHLRRGNFAHYTDDAPLFGKFTGTFWRPATVVGEEKRGVVVKDYKVLPPEEQAS